MVDLDSFSKKWSYEILSTLKDGSKRFNELMKPTNDPKITINSRTLADRLKELEEQGLIFREIVSGRPPTSIYKLSDKGKKALDLIVKLKNL